MKKLSAILVIVAVAAICLVTSCKQEVYFKPSVDDFEFGEQIVYKNVEHDKITIGDDIPTGYICIKKADGTYAYAEDGDVFYYDFTKYTTFIPIIEDVESSGTFDYQINKKAYSSDVSVSKKTGGILVEWKYDTDSKNINEAAVKTKDGKVAYLEDIDSNGNIIYKEAKVPASYKKPKISEVTINVIATDKLDGTNKVEKEITVTYSETATETKETW